MLFDWPAADVSPVVGEGIDGKTTTDGGGEDVPSVVFARSLPEDVVVIVLRLSLRLLSEVPRGTGGEPALIRSSNRGYLLASTRNRWWGPATGGDGSSRIAANEGLEDMSRRLEFQAAGRCAETMRNDGALERAVTNLAHGEVGGMFSSGSGVMVLRRGPDRSLKPICTVS